MIMLQMVLKVHCSIHIYKHNSAYKMSKVVWETSAYSKLKFATKCGSRILLDLSIILDDHIREPN